MKCKECGRKFKTKNDRLQYCGKHRRREKPLQEIEGIHDCSTCLEILQKCEAELGLVLDEVEKLPSRTAEEIEQSRRQYFKATRQEPSTPTRYAGYLKRSGWRAAEMIAARKMLTVKSMSEMTGMHRSTIRRHLDQHLIRLGYMQRVGRSINVGPMLGQGLPRYNLYFDRDRTRWLPPIGYFGFAKADIDDNRKEFDKLNNEFKLASEELVLFWLRTRLRQLEERLLGLLSAEELDLETKGVILYGTQLAIERLLKGVLSKYAPSLSESGRKLCMLREEVSRITRPTVDGEIVDLELIRNIADELESGKSPLLKEQWAQTRINDEVNFVWHQLTFDMPTVIIDWKHEQSS